ncbi:MAG: precorrin-8X methylmutase [Acidimicrobiales bacterium]
MTSAAPRIHPIEVESYSIMASRVDFSSWPEPARSVVARMVHATADESFASSALIGSLAVQRAIGAIRSSAPVVCDSRMVVAGIPALGASDTVVCALDLIDGGKSLAAPGPTADTRSAAAIREAARLHPRGALWVVGNAPTALAMLLDLHEAGLLEPEAVIAVPVGYVGAEHAKRRLWESALGEVAITNSGERGGSPVAAAAVNSILRLAAS